MGSGFRTFTAGEVLTASNVQNYLMDQSVMVFGGSAARSSAIGTANFEEGMVSYLTDTDKVEAYNGTDWVSVAPTTSQGLTLINTTSFSGVSSQNITGVFSAAYTNYKMFINVVGSTTVQNVLLRMLSGTTPNTAANYNRQIINFSNTTIDNQRDTGLTSFRVSRCSSSMLTQSWSEIAQPFATENTQIWSFFQIDTNSGWTSDANVLTVTTSYDGFQIFPVSGTITGSVNVYGYAK
jgi:hypothetical protein